METLTPTLTPAGMWKNKDEFTFGTFYLQCIQAIFMDRESDKAARDKSVENIGKRQKDIEEGDIMYGPILIFPEGTSHNDLYLHRFRRGAFTAERAIQPFLLCYEWDSVSPCYDCVRAIDYGMLLLSQFGLRKVHLDFLPVFVPNDYLFTEYRKSIPGGDKMERWEVYAHALRDMMTEVGGFGQNDQ